MLSGEPTVTMPALAAESPPARVGAVVVTYHPELATLQRLLAALVPQVAALYLVDNGSGPATTRQLAGLVATARAQLLLFADNRGIAAAHNRGLERCIQEGCDFVVLFDQDSIPAPDLVHKLVAAHRALTAQGARVAAVGPRWVDQRSDRQGEFYRIRGGRIVPVPAGNEPVEVDFLISSGTLLAAPAVQSIGGMREDLFIDHVDTEWCLRAKTAGWKLYGLGTASISHALGDDRRRVWLWRWREVALHSPDRNYYQVRNTLLLLSTEGIDWNWRVAQCLRLLYLLIFYAVCVPPRIRRIARMIRGLRDGLKGVGGRL